MNVVREAIEQGAGQPLGAEDLRAFVMRQIRGDQRRALFVALRWENTSNNNSAPVFDSGT